MEKRGRKKKNIEFYFGEKQEKAVLDYINSDCSQEKNEIYNKYLAEPFRIMKESILRRYPAHVGAYSMEEVEHNALTHMLEQMVKFNPDAPTKTGRPAKAYSYCGTIIHNYYKNHSKTTYNEKTNIVSFDDYFDENKDDEKHSYRIDDEFDDDNSLQKLIKLIIKKIKNRLSNVNIEHTENEIIVGEAIIIILENWNVLFIEDVGDGRYQKNTSNKFTKNKILLYLRELTGLTTKDIRFAMRSFRELYFMEKDDFFDE